MVLLVMSVKLPPPRNLISCTLPPVMNEQNINITNPRSSGLHFCSTWRQVMWTSLSLDLCCIGLAAGYFYTILYFIKLHTLWKNPKEIWFQFTWRNSFYVNVFRSIRLLQQNRLAVQKAQWQDSSQVNTYDSFSSISYIYHSCIHRHSLVHKDGPEPTDSFLKCRKNT